MRYSMESIYSSLRNDTLFNGHVMIDWDIIMKSTSTRGDIRIYIGAALVP